MQTPFTKARWRHFAKIALIGLGALAAVPFIIVALFGSAGGRRS